MSDFRPTPTDPSEVIDRTILVGITYVDAAGTPLTREQYYGRITAVDLDRAIDVTLPDGSIRSFTPILQALIPAEPGRYTLESTGEIVDNPDFVALLEIQKTVQ